MKRRLIAQFPGIDAADVRRTVDTAFRHFDGSPEREFIPLLVEKRAARVLAAAAQVAQIANR
ncbi:three-helix bundle dimerization domain-containing protein [Gordonia sp. NPDC003424]